MSQSASTSINQGGDAPGFLVLAFELRGMMLRHGEGLRESGDARAEVLEDGEGKLLLLAMRNDRERDGRVMDSFAGGAYCERKPQKSLACASGFYDCTDHLTGPISRPCRRTKVCLNSWQSLAHDVARVLHKLSCEPHATTAI